MSETTTKRGWRPPIEIKNGLAIIPLTRGMVAIIDEIDLPKVQDRIWHPIKSGSGKTFYAASGTGKRLLLMHRVIAGTPEGMFTDHKSRNGLDNRRLNLRICDQRQNQANTIHREPRSGYKGVYRARNGYQVRMRVNGKFTHLGYFTVKEDAARFYDQKAREIHGEFARLNFPDES